MRENEIHIHIPNLPRLCSSHSLSSLVLNTANGYIHRESWKIFCTYFEQNLKLLWPCRSNHTHQLFIYTPIFTHTNTHTVEKHTQHTQLLYEHTHTQNTHIHNINMRAHTELNNQFIPLYYINTHTCTLK